jgi:hypothetical protein
MGLREFLEEIANRRKTITVFAPEHYDELESYFESRNIAVEYESLPDDSSGGFVVVTEDGEFVGSVGADAISHLVSSTPSETESGPNETTQMLLDLLADTTFVSFDKRQLLMIAREIEDRAYRRGHGTLRTGFQSLSAMKAQRDVYTTLSVESNLDVHVYGEPDWSPGMPEATVHAEEADEIGAFWFLVFDGGGDDQQACALIAEETDPGRFRGFWTYDAETVGDIDAYLREAY